jgi:hypothetical protein
MMLSWIKVLRFMWIGKIRLGMRNIIGLRRLIMISFKMRQQNSLLKEMDRIRWIRLKLMKIKLIKNN